MDTHNTGVIIFLSGNELYLENSKVVLCTRLTFIGKHFAILGEIAKRLEESLFRPGSIKKVFLQKASNCITMSSFLKMVYWSKHISAC